MEAINFARQIKAINRAKDLNDEVYVIFMSS